MQEPTRITAIVKLARPGICVALVHKQRALSSLETLAIVVHAVDVEDNLTLRVADAGARFVEDVNGLSLLPGRYAAVGDIVVRAAAQKEEAAMRRPGEVTAL